MSNSYTSHQVQPVPHCFNRYWPLSSWGLSSYSKECHPFTLTNHIFTARQGILTGDLLTISHTEWPLTVWRMSPIIDRLFMCVFVCVCLCASKIFHSLPVRRSAWEQNANVSKQGVFILWISTELHTCTFSRECLFNHNSGYGQTRHASLLYSFWKPNSWSKLVFPEAGWARVGCPWNPHFMILYVRKILENRSFLLF